MTGDLEYEVDVLEMTLGEAIDAGETPSIEYKREIPSDVSDVAKEVVALTNNGGGILVVGVADDGTVRGWRTHERQANASRESFKTSSRLSTSTFWNIP